MAIEISPSEEHDPEEPSEETDGPGLLPVPPQDNPTQFYEWALRREQLRLRRLIWVSPAFTGPHAIAPGAVRLPDLGHAVDNEPQGNVVVATIRRGQPEERLDALEADFRDLTDQVEALAGAGGTSEEDLGEITEQIDQFGRQLARVNRQSKAAIECLNGAIASLDEAVRDLLRQDISANEFVQRSATDCS